MQLLVEETNRYYHQYLDTIAEGRSPLPDVTIPEMYLFIPTVLQMGHDQRDRLKDYWSILEQFFMAFYGNTMKQDRFLHILRFLHFSGNRNEPVKTDENYDRLWKMRTIFDKLNDAYTKYYSPTEHLATDEIIVLFKGRVVFKQYIPKKHKLFGIKIYKLCDSKGHTYMSVYLERDRKCATASMTTTHATVTGLTTRIENFGHKFYMDNFFSSPDLFDDLHTKAKNCCGTVTPNRKGMPTDFGTKLRLKQGDLKTRVRGDLTSIVRKNKRNVNMLTNMHHSSAEGNFCDEHGNALKPAIVQDYNRHMGYVDMSDRMMNSYSISRYTWKWTKKIVLSPSGPFNFEQLYSPHFLRFKINSS
jgi:hypothetical protein